MKNFVVGKYVDYEDYNVLACFNSMTKVIDYIKKRGDELSYVITVVAEDNVLGTFSIRDVDKYTTEYNLANFLVKTFDKFLDEAPTYKINKVEYDEYFRCKEVVRIYNIMYQEDNT